jgi:isochorismate pyruvate lyase
MKNTVKSAEDCQNMTDLRQAIDALDGVLVLLLARRQRYIERAAQIKGSRAAVRDEARVEDVVAKVLIRAGASDLSPAIAEPVWRALIEASIQHEFAAFDAINGPQAAK